jgi:type IV pilus assembly PilO-like protein
MKRDLSQPVQIALAIVGVLVFALAGYFLVIRPQHAKEKSLSGQITETSTAIDSARALTLQARNAAQIRVADIFRLTKAMPDQAQMADILLELNQVAAESGITFEQISPASTAVVLDGYVALPIQVQFQGNFYELSDFLYRLRNLVDIRHGGLDAKGRLFAIDTIDFGQAPPPAHFPQIEAQLQIDAFVYGTGAVPTVAAPTGTTGATGATGATGTTGAAGAAAPAGGS